MVTIQRLLIQHGSTRTSSINTTVHCHHFLNKIDIIREAAELLYRLETMSGADILI